MTNLLIYLYISIYVFFFRRVQTRLLPTFPLECPARFSPHPKNDTVPKRLPGPAWVPVSCVRQAAFTDISNCQQTKRTQQNAGESPAPSMAAGYRYNENRGFASKPIQLPESSVDWHASTAKRSASACQIGVSLNLRFPHESFLYSCDFSCFLWELLRVLPNLRTRSDPYLVYDFESVFCFRRENESLPS